MSCPHRQTQRTGAVIVKKNNIIYLRTRCPSCRVVVDGLPEVQRDGSVIVRKWITSNHTQRLEFDPEES